MSVNVSIVRCGSYEPGSVEAAILAAAEPLGGFGWVKPGMTVAVKTNLISRMPPESAAIICERLRRDCVDIPREASIHPMCFELYIAMITVCLNLRSDGDSSSM